MPPSHDPTSASRAVAKIRRRLKFENRLLKLAAGLLFPRVQHDRKPQRVLLYRTARLGDFLVAVPAMVALRKALPEAEIMLMSAVSTKGQTKIAARSLAGEVRPPWFDLVAPSVVDRAIALEGDGPKALAQAAKAIVRDFDPDLTILLSYNLETFRQRLRKILFFRLAGLRSPLVGYEMRQTEDLDVHVQHREGMLEHNVVAAAKSVYDCPGTPPFDERDLTFQIDVKPEAKAFAEQLWRENGWDGRPVVALFPGGSKPYAFWPVAHYGALLEDWPTRPEPVFLALGAGSDGEITAALASETSRPVVDLSGKLSLMELAAVLERADLYLGSDTGPMHLATALGTRTIAIMNHHEFLPSWEPWNDRAYGLKHEVPCKGCYDQFRCPLGTDACIRDLPVRQVREAVRGAMAGG